MRSACVRNVSLPSSTEGSSAQRFWRSGWTGACADNGPDMFTAQRGGKPARHESVHDLHALEVARGRHDFEECAVDRQSARLHYEIGGARFANESSRRSVGSIWIGVIYTVDVLHDREPSGSKCVGDKKCTRVRAMGRDA